MFTFDGKGVVLHRRGYARRPARRRSAVVPARFTEAAPATLLSSTGQVALAGPLAEPHGPLDPDAKSEPHPKESDMRRTVWTGLFLLLFASSAAAQGSVARDRAALEALYHATDGDNWRNRGFWLLPNWDLRMWYGVKTRHNDGRVIELELWRNNLKGRIPIEIGWLDQLEKLSVGGNEIDGIPAAIGHLTNLHTLGLSDNNLTALPPEIGNLTKLDLLWLDGNRLQSFPATLGNLTRRRCFRAD